MKKVSLKFAGNWQEFGVDIIGFRIIGNLKTQFKFQEYKPSVDFIKIANGEPVMTTYKDYFNGLLLKGEGVIHQGYFIFSKGSIETSEKYKKFIEEYKKVEQEYKEYLDGTLYNALYDAYNFGFVKSLIMRAEIGVMSMSTFIEKMSQYCIEGAVDNIVTKIKRSA